MLNQYFVSALEGELRGLPPGPPELGRERDSVLRVEEEADENVQNEEFETIYSCRYLYIGMHRNMKIRN